MRGRPLPVEVNGAPDEIENATHATLPGEAQLLVGLAHDRQWPGATDIDLANAAPPSATLCEITRPGFGPLELPPQPNPSATTASSHATADGRIVFMF